MCLRVERFKYRPIKKIAFSGVRLMRIGSKIATLATRRIALQLFVVALFMGVAVATTPTLNISEQFSQLCSQIKTVVPIVAFSMLLLGGIIYAAGQIMGAETRARANVWATAMLTGGIIGLLIAASAPYIIWFFAGMFSNSPISYSDTFCQ